jgi:hypothetical protein
MNHSPELEIFSQMCRGCGRTFPQTTAFSNHVARCPLKKRKLANALAIAQDSYREKKRQRLQNSEKRVTDVEHSDSSFSTLTKPTVSDSLAAFMHDCDVR